MDATLQSDAAGPLFAKAAERFKEVTCTGLLNWGNVHVCVGHKIMDEAAARGASAASVRDAVLSEFAAAEGRYAEAMRFKPDFFDGACALAQLEFERGKLAAGLLVKPVRTAEDGGGESAEAAKAAADAAVALREALKRVTPADVAAAEPSVAKARAWFAQALAAVPAAEAAAAEAAGAGSSEQPPADLRAQALILEGNILYEWSQMLAAGGRPWRPVLDEATSHFTTAACSAGDIRAALKNHTMVAELDLGPEPEPAAPAAAAAPAAPKKADAAPKVPPPKGLPALEKKAKK